MYGKIFESMYTGSLYGRVEAISVFTALIVFADEDGFVDMSFNALVGRLGFPREFVLKGIQELLAPDEFTRSTEDSGARIKPVTPCHAESPENINGMIIVNHGKYRSISSRQEKRQQDRDRQRKKRQRDREKAELPEKTAPVTHLSRTVTKSRLSEAEAEAEAEEKKERRAPSSQAMTRQAMFDAFWSAVHRKVGKQKSATAFARAVDRVAQDREISPVAAATVITDRMKLFRRSQQARDPIQGNIHPATWLNEGRYEDDESTWNEPRGAPGAPSRDQQRQANHAALAARYEAEAEAETRQAIGMGSQPMLEDHR